jgi:hypothetical protein
MLHALAPVLGWLGLGGALSAGTLAGAWLLPGFRRLFIELAIVAAVASFVYAKGIHDGTTFKQAEWDAAEQAAVQRGKDADSAARRDVGGGLRDPYDRDDD